MIECFIQRSRSLFNGQVTLEPCPARRACAAALREAGGWAKPCPLALALASRDESTWGVVEMKAALAEGGVSVEAYPGLRFQMP